ERADRCTSPHEEDPAAVAQDDRDDGSSADARELDGPTVPVDADRVVVLQATHVDPIDHGNPGEDRADRDDSLGRGVDNARRAAELHPYRTKRASSSSRMTFCLHKVGR